MGFKIANNSILRSDDYAELVRGKTYPFERKGHQHLADNVPLWLTGTDWTARAEISIISQSIENNNIKGIFRVDYLYAKDEQRVLTNTFIRMYGGLSDPAIYLLSSNAEYQQALSEGKLTRDSLTSEGFIHATPKSQLNRLANKYYKDKEQPLILSVDKELVIPEIKWEPASGGLYPHIYGPLNINAVTEVEKISLNEDGNFHL
ncbi:DUF952 domain-containing protein [Colwellia hornerae]|uniref:DUF952 domain-containing protein n=1 Tax=Colwellia hornerae TaxID=89402 RepID=A0A5C6Q7S1_9GAMM|nr:DUF952 domain-containing protein [Colwellia hornerae]TWX50586.1 DUF952 domain-containing protein [Colwellia hornerae]TWX56142.1 DUF952 domain-containing protein [Colwellia hornerae]TWX64986.1 DUF952 domain-containing protein [Colwellia hornerae]